MKSQETLVSFTKYCTEHPEERFWQALRNWADVDFIMAWEADEFDMTTAYKMGMHDTFEWKNRTKV